MNPPRLSLRGERAARPEWRVLWCVGVFLGALILRSPQLFTSPRFWAEEATEYYSVLQNGALWDVFTLVVRGNFQLLTNLFAYVATFVPARWAPAITTYLALIVSMGLAALVGLFSAERRWPLRRTFAAVVLLALLPQGYEIYLNSTNVQWVCGLCLLLLCVLDLDNLPKSWRWWLYLCVGAFGLTGVPSVLLTPAFLIRKWWSPSKEHFRVGLILGVCAVIQLAVVATYKHPDRHMALNVYALGTSWILQTMLAGMITIDVANELAKHLRPPIDLRFFLPVVAAGVLTSGIAVRAALRSSRPRCIPMVLIALWVAVSCIQTIAAFGDPMDYVSGGTGGRYFMLGAVCFLLLLALSEKHFWPNVLLVVMLGAALYQAMYKSQWRDLVTNGPSWTEQLAACEGKRPCKVMVWPGPSFTIFAK